MLRPYESQPTKRRFGAVDETALALIGDTGGLVTPSGRSIFVRLIFNSAGCRGDLGCADTAPIGRLAIPGMACYK
jgi:hypothetical protein